MKNIIKEMENLEYHWDYYNSFVIQPMIFDNFENYTKYINKKIYIVKKYLESSLRFIYILESLLSPTELILQ